MAYLEYLFVPEVSLALVKASVLQLLTFLFINLLMTVSIQIFNYELGSKLSALLSTLVWRTIVLQVEKTSATIIPAGVGLAGWFCPSRALTFRMWLSAATNTKTNIQGGWEWKTKLWANQRGGQLLPRHNNTAQSFQSCHSSAFQRLCIAYEWRISGQPWKHMLKQKNWNREGSLARAAAVWL